VPKWDTVRKRVCVQTGVRGCAMRVHRCFCADHCGRRHARRRLHGQASSSGAILPIRIFHTHTHREAHRGAARHNKGMSRADESHRECIQGRGGGPDGPVPLPCRTNAMPSPMPGPGPPNGRPLASALRGLTRHGTGPAVAYRVGQWPPRPCMHSRRGSSARVIPWHFRFVFLVLQHVTGPATLVSTSGVCSPSLVSTPSTQL